MTRLPAPLFDTLKQLSLHTQYVHETLPFAQEDYRYANAFLHGYRSSEATFTAYRKKPYKKFSPCAAVSLTTCF